MWQHGIYNSPKSQPSLCSYLHSIMATSNATTCLPKSLLWFVIWHFSQKRPAAFAFSAVFLPFFHSIASQCVGTWQWQWKVTPRRFNFHSTLFFSRKNLKNNSKIPRARTWPLPRASTSTFSAFFNQRSGSSQGEVLGDTQQPRIVGCYGFSSFFFFSWKNVFYCHFDGDLMDGIRWQQTIRFLTVFKLKYEMSGTTAWQSVWFEAGCHRSRLIRFRR